MIPSETPDISMRDAECIEQRERWIELHGGFENAWDALMRERNEYRERAHLAEGRLYATRHQIHKALKISQGEST